MTEACGGPADPLDLGAGVFLRQLAHLDPGLASELDHVAAPVDVKGRNVNRDLSWYAHADCDVMAWSWFTRDPGEIREAVEFAAEIGAAAFIINGEKELRKRPRVASSIAEAAREVCDAHGLRLGVVTYSVPQTVRDFPWEAFAALCDFGMPEIYDREGAYDPAYPARAIDGFYEAGFRRVLPACGAYVRNGKPDPSRRARWRWRREAEIGRHLALFP
ncbi:MAG: hypothetical protein RID93_34055, partial [Sandaracinaceae bacterium]